MRRILTHPTTVALSVCSLVLFAQSVSLADNAFQVGLSRIEITPKTAMRLSGYSNRMAPTHNVEQPLWVRSMALQSKSGQQFVIVSLEALRITGVMTKQISEQIEKELSIPRERLVICATHTHSAPYIDDGATDFQLFSKALTSTEVETAWAYTDWLSVQIVKGIRQAVADLRPSKIEIGMGQVDFARNRRVIKNSRWAGFGVTEAGPVDHSVSILKISGADGKVRGVVFNYASHCTSISPEVNRICGDWAGYASQNIEETHPDVVALCTIGCGGDQNPEPRGDARFAVEHGKKMAEEIERVIATELKPITTEPVPSFGYAALPLEHLSIAEIRKQLKSSSLTERQRAENLIAVYEKMRRLPESYPMPIHTWKFGDELTMVFLGGEVVVQYALRLKKEIPNGPVWVTAYANDVFGYVASEKMRPEGGYEVDGSMIFYNQPGRWASGTEDLIVRRVQELLANPASESALSPEEAVKSFRLAEGFDIELVASEPLVTDPVSFAFGADGRLWVVEMGDYPRGNKEGGGKVKILYDDDGDGRMDRSESFLDHLSYPNGITTWKKGVLISCAPDIIYAEDTNNDGQADIRRVLFSGFDRSNPQHRVNGFADGLDNWIYLAGGDASPGVRSTKTGQVIDILRRDFRIQPETGAIETVSGDTQYGRTRDDSGNWFGNSNSFPLYHFVLSDRYISRNRSFAAPNSAVQLILPSPAPPVFPASRLVGRFNDLHVANRFTSACGPSIFRDTTLGRDMFGAALVCEPVHNLVHRSILKPAGATFTAQRHATEQKSEFMASTDVWSRPVRLATGPDGALWVADMYRKVIEHPEWIPLDWQKQINLRAGEERGRIYRVFKKGQRPSALPKLANLESAELVKQLESANGTVRDMAQRLLVDRKDRSANEALRYIAKSTTKPALARLHALCTLEGINGKVNMPLLEFMFKDPDERVVQRAVLLSEYWFNNRSERLRFLNGSRFHHAITQLTSHPSARVRFQVALTLGAVDSTYAGKALGELAIAHLNDSWMRTGILSSSAAHAVTILNAILEKPQPSPEWSKFTQQLIATELGSGRKDAIANVLTTILKSRQADSGETHGQTIPILAAFIDALERKQTSLAQLNKEQADLISRNRKPIDAIFAFARKAVEDNKAEIGLRQNSIRLLGRGLDKQDDDLSLLGQLLGPQTPPSITIAAINAMSRLESNNVVNILLSNWSSLTADIKNEILAILFRKSETTMALLDALESGTVLTIDLDAARRNLLLNHSDDAIRSRAEKLLANVRSASRQQVLADYEKVKTMTGNLFRGAGLFEKRCAACHRFRAKGNEIGPSLAALQNKSTENLITSILDPNQAVEHKYRSYTIITNDGNVYSGMITAAGTNSITLAQPSGRKDVILRADIDEFSGTGKSFMPEGLEKDLAPQALADVITFVQSQPTQGAVEGAQPVRQMLSEAGRTGVGEKVEGERRPLETSWLGPADIVYCSSANPQTTVRWQPPILEKPAEAGQPFRLRIPVALGGTGSLDSHKFELRINGKVILQLTNVTKDNSWTSDDKLVTAHYLLMNNQEKQSSGLLELALSSTHYAPGDQLSLEFASPAAQNESWLGVILPRD